jgi:hypothetical protein
VKGLIILFRDLYRIRLQIFCLNLLLTVILAAAAQAQAQPGSGTEKSEISSNSASAPAETSTVPPDQRVVLKVGDLQITQAAFEQYIADLESTQGPAELSRKQLGDNYASMLMLSHLAAEKHLDTTPQVQRLLAIDRTQILSNAEFAKLKAESAPTQAEIKAYYDAHLADYDVVEMQRLFIWAGNSSNAGKLTTEQAKALADQVRQIYASGGDSSRIQKLIAETPHGNEEIVFDEKPLPFQRGELMGPWAEKPFTLKPGEWTEIDNGPDAYLFIKVVNRSRRDLSQVSAQIEKKLQGQKLKAQLDELKKQTGIWMDETYFPSKPPVPKVVDRD